MRARAASTRAGRMRCESLGDPSHASSRLSLRLRDPRWLLRVIAPRRPRPPAARSDPPSCQAGLASPLRSGAFSLPFRAFRRACRRLPALRPAILFLDPGVDLFPMHLDFRWCLDAELDLSGRALENFNLHRVPDPYVLS